MENLFEFLNQQSDGRLIVFGIIFLVSTYYVMPRTNIYIPIYI